MDSLTLDEATHTYWVGKKKFDSVTKILQDLGLARNYQGISSFYAERGKAVHRACELIDKGTLDNASLDPRVRPYVEGYRKFIRESGYQPQFWELPLYHPALGFAGTVDKLGSLNGRFGILDIKTSRSLDPAVELQLCAYAVLWIESHPDSPPAFKYALQLTDDGGYKLHTKYSEASIELWLSAITVYRWKQTHRAA